ncbi:MAG: hypothetical protein Q8N23_15055 [Archangium sp.]|nr:hypothetical protein [Archangium sp.]MDP3574265.1 hypothetical protein [Archangium sp.]
MNRLSLVLPLVCCACGELRLPPPTACEQARFNAAVQLDFGEFFTAGQEVARVIADDAGTRLNFTTRRLGGRLNGELHLPVTQGSLPRTTPTDLGCALPERLQWRADLDGELHPMAGTIVSGGIDAGPGTDGGVDRSFTLELTGLRVTDDAGVDAITSASVVLPLIPSTPE